MKPWSIRWAWPWLVAAVACGGRAGHEADDGTISATDARGTPAASDDGADLDLPRPPGSSEDTSGAQPAVAARPTSPAAPASPPETAAPPAAAPSPIARAADTGALELRAAEDLLELYCGECHGTRAREHGQIQGDLADIGSLDYLVVRGMVVPLNASASRVYQVIADGSMPPPGVAPRPDQAMLDLLGDVIEPDRSWSDPKAGGQGSAGRPPDAAPTPQ